MSNSSATMASQRRTASWTVTGLRLLLALIFGLPLVFMIVASFKPDTQIFGDLGSINAFLPVGDLSLDNYLGVFDRVPFGRFLVNSILISVVTVALGIVVNSMAAFALSRMVFPGQKIILVVILATLIVPFETLALPLLWWVNQLPYLSAEGVTIGWLDTYEVQIIPFTANAFSLFLFYQYFDTIPKALDEAATVDGAGWFRIYRSVIMPLSGPAIATVAILTFLPAWNSYLWPLMAIQAEELRPAMVGIDYFKQLNVAWGQIMAFASMVTVPVLALFIAFQRAFISSIGNVQRIGLATSPDLITWTKQPDPIAGPDPRWYELLDGTWTDEAFRDPWVFRDPDGKGWHMLITARANHGELRERGVIGHATSDDLRSWTVRPPLTEPRHGFAQFEVPQYVEVDGQGVLIVNCGRAELAEWRRARHPECGAIWAVPADGPLGPYDFDRAQPLADRELYVGKVVAVRGTGRHVLLAFRNLDAQGRFVGEIIDPRPVGLREGLLVVLDDRPAVSVA